MWLVDWIDGESGVYSISIGVDDQRVGRQDSRIDSGNRKEEG